MGFTADYFLRFLFVSKRLFKQTDFKLNRQDMIYRLIDILLTQYLFFDRLFQKRKPDAAGKFTSSPALTHSAAA